MRSLHAIPAFPVFMLSYANCLLEFNGLLYRREINAWGIFPQKCKNTPFFKLRYFYSSISKWILLYFPFAGSTKLKDKSSQPASLQAILLLYLFLSVDVVTMDTRRPSLRLLRWSWLCLSRLLTGSLSSSCPPVTWLSRSWLWSTGWTPWSLWAGTSVARKSRTVTAAMQASRPPGRWTNALGPVSIFFPTHVSHWFGWMILVRVAGTRWASGLRRTWTLRSTGSCPPTCSS